MDNWNQTILNCFNPGVHDMSTVDNINGRVKTLFDRLNIDQMSNVSSKLLRQ